MTTEASGEAARQIACFIVTELDYPGPATDFVGSQPTRLTEAIDSAALMELAAFVEDTFRVQIQDDEIVAENFATVADVVRLLGDKGALNESPAAGGEGRERSRS